MSERFLIPFTRTHDTHTDDKPINIIFGMTFVACGGNEHNPAVVTGLGEEGSNGFESAVILFDKNEHGVYFPNKISTSGTTWRDILVTPGLSHLDRGLSDRLTVDEIYRGVLNGFSPRMLAVGSPQFKKSLQEESQRPLKTVTKLEGRWSSPK
ncbi:MAG: hypothetical protein H0W89_04915 [Candidatus Levybacteria bacterium]|nr:hypothetical protein [Candidatus Levybacteria bacterium]